MSDEAREARTYDGTAQYADTAYAAWTAGIPVPFEAFEAAHSIGWRAGYATGVRDGVAEGIRQAREAAAPELLAEAREFLDPLIGYSWSNDWDEKQAGALLRRLTDALAAIDALGEADRG